MATYRQLQQQISDLEKKAAVARKTEVARVVAGIKKQIAEYHLTAAELGLELSPAATVSEVPRAVGKGSRPGTAAAKTKKALPPKYKDPATGVTWSGRGKRPQWFVAAEKKGKVADLLINKQALPKVPGKAPLAKAAKAGSKPAAKKASSPANKKTEATAKPGPAKKPVTAKPVAEKGAAKPAAKKAAAKPAAKPAPAVPGAAAAETPHAP